jgi:multiple sugar transport system substrate-binding protein
MGGDSVRNFLRILPLAALLAGAASSAHAQVELNFWDQVWGPGSYSQRAQQLVDDFNKSQDDIHVTYRSVPWANWYETYVTAIASGSAPDISTGAGFQAVQFYSMDAIYPVDDLVKEMEADGSAKDFAPGTLEAMKYDGHMWPCRGPSIFVRSSTGKTFSKPPGRRSRPIGTNFLPSARR